MNAVVAVRIARESDGLGHTAEKLSYASINWIRFKGRQPAPSAGARWPLSPLPGLP